MDPITLSVRVVLAREEAFALLDELANHVADWSFDGPAAGVGGPAPARAAVPSQQGIDTDAIESVPPGQDGRHDLWRERAPKPGRGPAPPITTSPNRGPCSASQNSDVPALPHLRLRAAIRRTAVPQPGKGGVHAQTGADG